MSLPANVINSILPRPTLQDLPQNQSDIDNDIHYLLNWLSPYFPSDLAAQSKQRHNSSHKSTIAPSQRLRSAIRSCLKDDSSQQEFVRLYINSINREFHRFFSTTSLDDFEFMDYYTLIRLVLDYYNGCIAQLHLSRLVKNLFQRNLNALFQTHLIGSHSNSRFLGLLRDYLSSCLVTPLLESPTTHKNSHNPSKTLIDVITTLSSLNMTNEVNYILIRLSIQKIQKYVALNCSRVWDVALLHQISQFIQSEVYSNFSVIVAYSTDSGLADEINNAYLYELIKIAYDELVSLRIKEIFELVVSFPSSRIALDELYQCLLIKYNHDHYNDRSHHDISQTHNLINDVTNLTSFENLANYSLKTQSYQRSKLVETFIDLSHSHLLHSGSNTIDVITTYTKTINSFLIIDPKGVLLDKVVRPIRRYLKTREDIIIKLVHGLLDENDEAKLGLARELRATKRNKSTYTSESTNIEDGLDLHWIPDPIDALPDFKKGKVSDIIESLISIFDSKDIFIDEFTKLFGEKLLQLHNYDVSEIEEHLDLLKTRFGKGEFTMLDIMIRDIQESKIINEILPTGSSNPRFHSSILSHLYWTSLESKELRVPELIQNKFDDYNSKFSKLKRGRNLKFVPNLGLVKLNLKFKNRTMYFEVSPDKAAVISLFDEEENELSVDSIANKLNMSQYDVSKCLSFWVGENVLLELTRTLYIINDDEEDIPFEETGNSIPSISAASTESVGNKEHELIVLWPHLNTILENITSLSFERIKSLLKLTVPKEKMDLTTLKDSQLEDFLDWLVDENKILLSAGTYKLKR
ncbi:uncharacterized protein CANTADRAFT_52231 [Suhomyces tanzawaensis NRRL Y-17324]|uniref:Anaphase-promoting complex subunit 2 n=1 Tax=Suhomyces tanzawaensis NRRL Y-17324 TaxID=984487 RepID=A0A1E4SIT6_9ASCO|nr:uncharacterized protein CANTADRAFT_52231 [Suhomyces tanzawaensis NRRL Y-17324]ODV79342.1 hypothetical protein CANTADRAFT_52231 [Suhomyces tanzawaensis NRRL Y-17324]